MINISYDSICVTKLLSGCHVCVVYIMKVTSMAKESRILSAFLVCGSGVMQSPLARQTQMCLLCDPLLIDARVAFVELLVGKDRNVRREAHTAVTSSNTNLLPTIMGPKQVLRCNNSASESSSILDLKFHTIQYFYF
jgi:hypothetical protein